MEFELFLFAENLINNRDKIKESESFVLTLQKDKIRNETTQRRINVKKIVSLDETLNKPYSKVVIELNEGFNLNEIKKLLEIEGKTEISLVINEKNKKVYYNLQNPRKFDINQLKAMKSKQYVKKITV